MNNFEKEKNNATIINKFEKTITAYDLGRGFFVETDRGPEETNFHLYHKDYGTKMVMFEILSRDAHYEEALIIANAHEYIEIYSAEYMDVSGEEDLEV